MNGSPLALWRGMPPRMQMASGSTVAVVLCFQAASPAGVRGSFKPGRSFAIFPVGTVFFMPFQYPFRSGCPSAVLGTWDQTGTATIANSQAPTAKNRIPMIEYIRRLHDEDKAGGTPWRGILGSGFAGCSAPLLRGRIRCEQSDPRHGRDQQSGMDQSALVSLH